MGMTLQGGISQLLCLLSFDGIYHMDMFVKYLIRIHTRRACKPKIYKILCKIELQDQITHF